MFDFLTNAVKAAATPVKQFVDVVNDPSTLPAVVESYANPGVEPSYDDLSSMYFGDEEESTTGEYWTQDNDPFGQYLREEDEEAIMAPDPYVDLQMVDDNDAVGKAHMARNPMTAENGFTDLDSMVDAAIVAAAGAPIRDFTISDHGRPGLQTIGETRLTSESLKDPAVLETLARLEFAEDAQIRLDGCRTGGDEVGDQFLRDMARATNRPVTGSNAYQSPFSSGVDGPSKTCYPPAIDENGDLVQTCTVETDGGDPYWQSFSEMGRESSEMTPAETRVIEP